jgi:hypothetical protein
MGRTQAGSGTRDVLPQAVDRRDERRDDPREYVRRRSLLHDDPGIELVDMATLVAIPRASEEGAVRR